jgi:hypothetical protein
MNALRSSRPPAVRTGTFCRFGDSLEMRPVVVASWLNVAWMRPSAPTSGGSASA